MKLRRSPKFPRLQCWGMCVSVVATPMPRGCWLKLTSWQCRPRSFNALRPSLRRAEIAWLKGDFEQMRDEASFVLNMAKGHDDPWLQGEFAFWMWRGGAAIEMQEKIAAPYALQVSGDWRAAADAARALEQRGQGGEQRRLFVEVAHEVHEGRLAALAQAIVSPLISVGFWFYYRSLAKRWGR